MKKALITTALLSLSTFSVANTAPVYLPEQAMVEPKLVLGVFEVTGDSTKQTNQNAISRSNANHRICWVAYDLNASTQVSVTENIISPKKTTFETANGQTISSADGKQHQVMSTLPNQNGVVSQCWQFSKQDPIGQYSIEVKIDDTTFSKQTFNVVK